MVLFHRIINKIYRIYLKIYPQIYQKVMIKWIRRKESIRVLFVILDLGQWKTEQLYLRMLEHEHFEPILGITLSKESPKEKQRLRTYLNKKNYYYIDLDENKQSFEKIKADIVFYQKPYDTCYQDHVLYKHHLNHIFCYCPYGIHTLNEKWNLSLPTKLIALQNYYENELTKKSVEDLYPEYAKNIVVTGLPFNDKLLQPKESFPDPWKLQGKKKKRIIYAPHHTIGDMHYNGIAFSTFLENGDFILEMAKKYKDKVQWAFKPHPFLYSKLVKLWGKDKTDAYYQEWNNLENTQLERGEYTGLFMHSDALIHDCNSFMVEYHYTLNPVLYLINGIEQHRSLNSFGEKAFSLHYKATNHNEIESFVLNILKNEDPLFADRRKFYEESLLPPYGNDACDNIINAILGKKDYKS